MCRPNASIDEHNQIHPEKLLGQPSSMSTPSSELTLSGLLYEGNYDDWRQRVNDLLKQHDANMLALWKLQWRPTSIAWPYWLEPDPQDLVESMACEVHVNTLSRVPASDRQDRQLLLEALARVAKHSRLLDLPSAVRSRVYQLHWQGEPRSWNLRLRNEWGENAKVPELFLVSHLIHHECRARILCPKLRYRVSLAALRRPGARLRYGSA
jgi:hypothetical protein